MRMAILYINTIYPAQVIKCMQNVNTKHSPSFVVECTQFLSIQPVGSKTNGFTVVFYVSMLHLQESMDRAASGPISNGQRTIDAHTTRHQVLLTVRSYTLKHVKQHTSDIYYPDHQYMAHKQCKGLFSCTLVTVASHEPCSAVTRASHCIAPGTILAHTSQGTLGSIVPHRTGCYSQRRAKHNHKRLKAVIQHSTHGRYCTLNGLGFKLVKTVMQERWSCHNVLGNHQNPIGTHQKGWHKSCIRSVWTLN